MLKLIKLNGELSENIVTLSVTAAKKKLMVSSGKFRIAGQDRELEDDVVFEVDERQEKTTVIGSLVLEIDTGKVRLLVDEVVHNGTDRNFDFSEGRLKLLHNLFHVVVPPGRVDLTAETIEVTHIESTEAADGQAN